MITDKAILNPLYINNVFGTIRVKISILQITHC